MIYFPYDPNYIRVSFERIRCDKQSGVVLYDVSVPRSPKPPVVSDFHLHSCDSSSSADEVPLGVVAKTRRGQESDNDDVPLGIVARSKSKKERR